VARHNGSCQALDSEAFALGWSPECSSGRVRCAVGQARLPADSGGADGFAREHRRSHPLLRPGEAYSSFFKLPSNTCQLPPSDSFATGPLNESWIVAISLTGSNPPADSPAFQITKPFAGKSIMHRDAATKVLRLQLRGGGSMRRQIGCINSWPVIELPVAVLLTVAAGVGLKHDSTQSLC
jgi:hypothetical protein